ncbi:MAG: AAA family ATPase [Candidatus Omnitrophica bacterium]|nr:AAA family ATPase [Candidatus Omnitrophota bacterium]
MINALKLKNYRGIKEIKLEELGHINVICGKNSSGKTSLVEAICNPSNCIFGMKVSEQEHINEIETTFEIMAKRYTTPNPGRTIPWFKNKIKELINQTVFIDGLDSIQQRWGNEFHKWINHGADTFKFSEIIKIAINKHSGNFKPILIPPKRVFDTRSTISNLDPSISSENTRILNRLFELGTQDDKSPEYKLIETIRVAFREISSGCEFHTSLKGKHVVIKFKNGQGDWIDADASGLGLREVLVILSYLLDSDYSMILIEEPENHLHPDMQRRLLQFFTKVKDKQLFLTTHSNIFLDSAYIDKAFYLEFKNGEVTCSDETSRTNILTNLGYSTVDNLVSDLIVFTEGVLDIPVIREICSKLGFLHQFSIKLYPLGGDIMHHLDLSVFTEKSKVMAIVDSDPGSQVIRNEFVDKCHANNIPVTKLEKYSTENYFSIRAIKAIYPHQQIPATITILNPKVKVKTQLGFSVKSKSREIAKEMSLEEFKDTDLLEFCKSIHKICLDEI